MTETYKILPTGDVEKTIPEVKEIIAKNIAEKQLAQLKSRIERCPLCKRARETIAKLEAIGVKEAAEIK